MLSAATAAARGRHRRSVAPPPPPRNRHTASAVDDGRDVRVAGQWDMQSAPGGRAAWFANVHDARLTAAGTRHWARVTSRAGAAAVAARAGATVAPLGGGGCERGGRGAPATWASAVPLVLSGAAPAAVERTSPLHHEKRLLPCTRGGKGGQGGAPPLSASGG